VRRILDSHSRIHCGPEVKFFRDFFDEYRDDPLRHLRYLQSARALVDDERLLEIAGRSFVELHREAARRAGKPRWADKNPENVLFTREWDRLLGDRWVFIHVVRNPLDTLASLSEARFPLSVPESLEERIALYKLYTSRGLRFAGDHADRSYLLVYEELAADPEKAVGMLMEWLGERPEAQQLRFNDVHHQPGLEDAKVGGTREVHCRSVGRWRSDLAGHQARRIWTETAELWLSIDPLRRHVRPPL
jgi:hypothetical protein